tara:strand:- start:66 stop:569 length:504 start_codon:yes stop_codon:yes gene_type:complete
MKVQRFFLEVKKIDHKIIDLDLPKDIKIVLEYNKNFKINKFFYKQIGIDHYWRDRLVWSDDEWSNYLKNINLETWLIKNNNELIGFYETEFHPNNNEVELINMGILKEFRGKKYGSKLLAHVINSTFERKALRLWVHTCSLDHKYALKNYQSKGFKVFKEEEISFVA